MNLRTSIVILAGIALSACTTVNMTELPSSAGMNKASVQENVVVKASDRLEEQFSKKGWIDRSAFKMKQAAITLLRGRDAATEQTAAVKYANNVSEAALKSDIVEATQIASQTLRAADVYLEYAEVERDMTPDLQSLEKALLNCRQAEGTFRRAADIKQLVVDVELSGMADTLDKLQLVTDIYGEKVRSKTAGPTFADTVLN